MAVKGSIQFAKWAIHARTHCTVELDASTFRANVLPHSTKVTPSDWSEGASSDVVVASISGSNALGEVFGKTKITGGSRLGTWTADLADVIFYPKEGKANIWVRMGGCAW